MKTVRATPKYSIINVRGLIFIYILLCILTVLFSRSFFSDTLYEGRVPDRLNLIVFFTIPAVLVVFLGLSAYRLLGDIIARKPGSKFEVRLLAYFFIIVIFAAAPMSIVTGISIAEILRFWRNIDTVAATAAARSFTVDNYSLHIEKFESILKETDFSAQMAAARGSTAAIPAGSAIPAGIAAIQDFQADGNDWKETAFIGEESRRLPSPPAIRQGFVSRELPRDMGLIRYVLFPAPNTVRLVSYNLGDDFDIGMAAIERQGAYFETIDFAKDNIRPLLFFYFGVFFFPTLLMTLIIAISFTRRVTHPIVELTEATRRIAEGDFSIQILSRRGDELGLLIRSFNSMVQDLEKSRAALVKAEKISIWQNMAQQLAHEIKNPLTPIKLSAERVLRRWRNEPERIDEILEDSMLAIIQETEGLSTLLTEFRTLSKPAELAQSWCRLRETTEETINPYRNSYPHVQFDIGYTKDNIIIKIDKHRLAQVLTNLIINAIDAMDGKGTIEIRADLIRKREILYCRLSIKDSGKGISPKEVPLVFTPYFTTKDSGTGLGLPIVERIVNDHGGAIWFNSAEGMGAIFYIDLPVEEKP
ncbi:MAG: HAMP domain-containing protein [Treponema sp.]|nr:HAMP domain-containing protein [Treponema sp.]